MRKGWFKSFAGMLAMLIMLTLGWGVAEDMPAGAATLAPGATMERGWEASGARLCLLRYEATGEAVIVLVDADGQTLLAETVEPASVSSSATMERSAAEELIRSAYPDCRVLYSEDGATGKRMAVVGDGYWGSIVVAGGCIVSRRLEAGEMYSGGRLSLHGALRVLELYRPEAELSAIELDNDDGRWIFEGDAVLHDELYEFELDAISARLLEWERD